MTNRLIAILWFAFVIITSLFFFPIALLIRVATGPFDRRLLILQQFTCFWAALYTWIVPAWPIKIQDRHKIRRGTVYVVVSNHQSLLDILVIFNLFFHFKFVSKIEIFRIPLIGWNMSLNRYIKLKRGDKQSIAKMMADAQKALAGGNSVLIFAEGTRSPDGNIKAFKPGAFILASQMKVPILPVVISGTNKALPKKSFNFHGSHPICIRVLDEISPESFSDLTVEALTERVRTKMIDELRHLSAFLQS